MVQLCTHFLENVIDANSYPLPEITDLAQRIRRIGLGVMGWADLLIKLGLPYDSDEAVELARKVQQFVDDEAKNESERLATLRGVFPEWEKSIWGPDATCARDANGERVRPMKRLRNCNVTTVAPTGTISIIAGCSSGIEPLFAVAFMRNQAGVLMPDVNEDFVAIAKAEGWYSEELMKRIAASRAHRLPRGAGEVAAGLRHRQPHQARVAHPAAGRLPGGQRQRHQQDLQLRPRRHRGVRRGDLPPGLQARLQGRHRLPRRQPGHAGALNRGDGEEGGRRDVGGVGRVGRVGGSTAAAADLHGELAEVTAENERLRKYVHELEAENLQRRQKRMRPELLRGSTRRVETPLGTLYVTITEDDKGQPFEVFMSLGKAGGALMADVEALGRLISLSLRSGIPMKEIHRQLRGISSDRVLGLGPQKVLSVPDAVGIAIETLDAREAGHPAGTAPGHGQHGGASGASARPDRVARPDRRR